MDALLLSLVLVAIAPLAPSPLGQVLYVDADAVGAGSGASWADAYTNLDAGLAAAGSGDQLWVAEGTYLPSIASVPSNPRTSTFTLPDGVAVYGGFAGTETALGQRNPDAHPSVLSGDLGVPGVGDDDAYHVVSTQLSGTGTRLDGLVIADGQADGTANEQKRGAGLAATASSLTVSGCRFVDNASALVSAAAYFAGGGSPVLERCAFVGNSSGAGFAGTRAVVRDCTFSGQAASSLRLDAQFATLPAFDVRGCAFTGNAGAGVVAVNAAGGRIAQCTFSGNGNSALSTFQAGVIDVRDCEFGANAAPLDGGAASLTQGQLASFTRCTFAGNSAASSGGAVFANASSVRLVGCRFLGNNSAVAGGAVATVSSSPLVVNCVFSGNASTRGGALSVAGAGAPELIASTLSGNTASAEGGGVYGEAGLLPVPGAPDLAVYDAILWGNADAGGADESAQLTLSSGTLDVHRSCVQGWTGGLGGVGNHGLDPDYTDADGADDVLGTEDDDVTLQSGSPCIDAGDATLLPADTQDLDCDGDVEEPLALDIALVRRVDDDPFTADSGAGGAPVVDMGAYESSAWRHAGHALVGTGVGGTGAGGEPCLVGEGTLLGGTPMGLALHDAAPGAPATLIVGFDALLAPFKGGVLVPAADLLFGRIAVGGTGDITLAATWPTGLPAGAELWMQWWIVDAAGPAGLAASNGVRATTP